MTEIELLQRILERETQQLILIGGIAAGALVLIMCALVWYMITRAMEI